MYNKRKNCPMQQKFPTRKIFIRNIHIRENPLSNNVKENGQRSFEFCMYLDHKENVRYLFQVTFYRHTQ